MGNTLEGKFEARPFLSAVVEKDGEGFKVIYVDAFGTPVNEMQKYAAIEEFLGVEKTVWPPMPAPEEEAAEAPPADGAFDEAAAIAAMSAMFDRIDAIVNKDGSVSKEELTAVFGEHAAEFLKFCDADGDTKLTKDEFTNGIIGDCKSTGMDMATFNAEWADRMEAAVKAAEDAKANQ